MAGRVVMFSGENKKKKYFKIYLSRYDLNNIERDVKHQIIIIILENIIYCVFIQQS